MKRGVCVLNLNDGGDISRAGAGGELWGLDEALDEAQVDEELKACGLYEAFAEGSTTCEYPFRTASTEERALGKRSWREMTALFLSEDTFGATEGAVDHFVSMETFLRVNCASLTVLERALLVARIDEGLEWKEIEAELCLPSTGNGMAALRAFHRVCRKLEKIRA